MLRRPCERCATCSSHTRHEFRAIDSESCGSPPQLVSKPVEWKRAAIAAVSAESFKEHTLTRGRAELLKPKVNA